MKKIMNWRFIGGIISSGRIALSSVGHVEQKENLKIIFEN